MLTIQINNYYTKHSALQSQLYTQSKDLIYINQLLAIVSLPYTKEQYYYLIDSIVEITNVYIPNRALYYYKMLNFLYYSIYSNKRSIQFNTILTSFSSLSLQSKSPLLDTIYNIYILLQYKLLNSSLYSSIISLVTLGSIIVQYLLISKLLNY